MNPEEKKHPIPPEKRVKEDEELITVLNWKRGSGPKSQILKRRGFLSAVSLDEPARPINEVKKKVRHPS